MEATMGNACINCGKDMLYNVSGELIFNNHIKKKCTAVFCKNCDNWESVPSLISGTQVRITNPYDEIKRCMEIIARHERDMEGMSDKSDNQTSELQKTKQALSTCQNELLKLKQTRQLR
jgi:hypothetical protein